MRVVDFDIAVSSLEAVLGTSTLSRLRYRRYNIGSRKVDAINEILMEINPYMKTTDCVRVVADNREEIFMVG